MPEEPEQPQPLLPVTAPRIFHTFQTLHAVPFINSAADQVVVIHGGVPLRIVVRPKGLIQGFGHWTRTPNVAHAAKVATFVSQFNMSTYLPRLTTDSDDQGNIHVMLDYVFSWPGVATDRQVASELQAFTNACLLAMRQLNTHFPDPWTHAKKVR